MKFPLMLRSTHEKALKDAEWYANFWRKKHEALEIALEKARRNDTPQDPETGRFVKK